LFSCFHTMLMIAILLTPPSGSMQSQGLFELLKICKSLLS
jgi:hypothetical protein